MNVEIITDDLQFPEGPIAMADGSVILVEIRRRTLTRVWPDGRKEIVAELGGGPNGAAIGPDGAIYVTNNGGFGWAERADGSIGPHGTAADYKTGSIQRVDLTSGSVTTLYVDCDGVSLRGPNDLVFDQDGGFWFSDPGKSNGEWVQWGRLFYARADGSLIRLMRDNMVTTNGVGLSPDQRTVYAAETLTSRLWAFELAGPGAFATDESGAPKARVLGPLPGLQMLDSLAVEADGNIAVGTLINGGITVFSPTGNVEHLPFPDSMITNICFGGPDMRDAWITASATGKLLKCRWPRPGLALNFNA